MRPGTISAQRDMKYRLVELLRCPAHPRAMLRVTGARVSEVFPYSGQLQVPVCRTGCGYLANWFIEIPATLPISHRLDCRRCMGTEIETAELTCPECQWSLKVVDGVIRASGGCEKEPEEEAPLPQGIGGPIDRYLDPQPGEVALILASLPESTLAKWSSRGVERLQVELNPEVMVAGRARCCANGQGMVHYIGGPLDISIFRPGEFDALVVQVPSERVSAFDQALEQIPALLRPSGKAVLVYPHEAAGSHGADDRRERLIRDLPKAFDGLTTRVARATGIDLVMVEHPEPENGNGLRFIKRSG